MERKAFLNRTRVGLILRTYATKEDQIPDRLRLTQEAVTRAKQITVDGLPVFRRIDVMVWTDRRYKEADCGKTAETLSQQFKNEKDIYVHEYAHGDIFCGILNHAIALQMRDRVDYSTILSSDASSYFNSETVTTMIDAACHGALAIGVAINELTESVMAGRLANTFAMWHNVSLMSVGGFDLRASKPVDDRAAHYLKGWHEAKGDVFYQLAGVEEVIPLARLVENHGPCLAAILPQGDGVKGYEVPDPATQTELYARHLAKMGTKFERQTALLATVGFDPSYLKGGVMNI